MEVTLTTSEDHIQKMVALPSACHDALWDLENHLGLSFLMCLKRTIVCGHTCTHTHPTYIPHMPPTTHTHYTYQ